MKRIFIVGSSGFPRGTAGANYDQYVALSLIEAGWQVTVLGSGKNYPETKVADHYEYKGITYENMPYSRAVKYGYELGFYKKAFKKYNITPEDYFIIRDLGWLPQWWLAKKCGTEHMCYVHFEDLQPTQVKMHLINPQYWSLLLKWHFKFNKIKKALPISEVLENIERGYGCKTLRLPCLADPDEFGEALKTKKPETVNIIYPGAKTNGCEDNIELMLESLSALSDEERSHVRLHITGTTEEKLKAKLGERVKIIDELKNVLVIHNWLTYTELVELYRQMDFMLLVRFMNPVTLANFPSKVPETLSFGIIPICTRVGEYTQNYLFDGENSIVFEPDSNLECIDAIKKAINMSNEEYLRLRSSARKTAVEKFGYKNWSQDLSDFILGEDQ